MLSSSIVPLASFAEDDVNTHTVTFLDYDGNVMQKINVKEGEVIDYSKIDTSSLDYHIDKFRQVRFSEWTDTPTTVYKDTTLQALSETGVIQISSLPEKTLYFNKDGNVDTGGLKVQITIITQLKFFDDNGERMTQKIVQDISQTCVVEPKKLSQAFSSSDSAKISIYPLNSNLAIYEYKIQYAEANIGDVKVDGNVDAIDASEILSYYANLSIGKPYSFSEQQLNNGDVNKDGQINALDASYVLTYYAINATKGNAKWESILKK